MLEYDQGPMKTDTVYPVDKLRKDLEREVAKYLGLKNLDLPLAPAPPGTQSDLGFQVAPFAAKTKAGDANALAIDLSHHLRINGSPYFETVGNTGPYVNFRLEMGTYGHEVINGVLKMRDRYGKESLGHGKKVVIDMSSPNIAKRMSVGHLRSTIIGDAIARLHEAKGYQVIKDNHIGDWGTQFGKLIVAIKNWGNEGELLRSGDPIGILQDLYVKFHQKAEDEKEKLLDEAQIKIQAKGIQSIPGLREEIERRKKGLLLRKKITAGEIDETKLVEDSLGNLLVPKLENEGRAWFLKLEKGDKEARRLWKLCVDLSMKEFKEVYDVLKVDFDLTLGESFYEDKMADVIKEIRSKGVGKTSQGALVVDMQDKALGVAIIEKSDGATLYMTRDLATAIYRERVLKGDESIYVVGEDQKLYFQQLFEILRRLGHKMGDNSAHVYFGMISLPEGKMSTRAGRVILLKDVIAEGLRRAQKVFDQRKRSGLTPADKAEIIRRVAIGALKWNDLAQDPRRSITFDWDKALSLEGNSAPYVQYAAVRAQKILESSGVSLEQILSLSSNEKGAYSHQNERSLVLWIANYPAVLRTALEQNNPSAVATYTFELAKRFNLFYTTVPVLKAGTEGDKLSRLKLVTASLQVMSNSLNILGIEIPREM